MKTVHLRTADLGSVRVRQGFQPQLDQRREQIIDKRTKLPTWVGLVVMPGGVSTPYATVEQAGPIEVRIKFHGPERDVPELGRFVRFGGKATISASFFESGFGLGAKRSTNFTVTAERYETTDERPGPFDRWVPVEFPPTLTPPEILTARTDDRGRQTVSLMLGAGIVEGGAEVEYPESVEALVYEPVDLDLVAKLVTPAAGDETRRDKARLYLIANSITRHGGSTARGSRKPEPAPQPATVEG